MCKLFIFKLFLLCALSLAGCGGESQPSWHPQNEEPQRLSSNANMFDQLRAADKVDYEQIIRAGLNSSNFRCFDRSNTNDNLSDTPNVLDFAFQINMSGEVLKDLLTKCSHVSNHHIEMLINDKNLSAENASILASHDHSLFLFSFIHKETLVKFNELPNHNDIAASIVEAEWKQGHTGTIGTLIAREYLFSRDLLCDFLRRDPSRLELMDRSRVRNGLIWNGLKGHDPERYFSEIPRLLDAKRAHKISNYEDLQRLEELQVFHGLIWDHQFSSVETQTCLNFPEWSKELSQKYLGRF